MQEQQEPKTVDVTADLDQLSREASASFFITLEQFSRLADSKNVSKKDLIRAMKHGFNHNLTDVKVSLRSMEEKFLSDSIKELIKCYIIMYAKLNDQNQNSSEQDSLTVGTEGESNGLG
jgi:hypothetical protein